MGGGRLEVCRRGTSIGKSGNLNKCRLIPTLTVSLLPKHYPLLPDIFLEFQPLLVQHPVYHTQVNWRVQFTIDAQSYGNIYMVT